MIDKLPFVLYFLFFLFMYYKLFLEKRFSWIQIDDDDVDPKGISCSSIIFTDKLLSGLQVEYFYKLDLNVYLVNKHIKSKNRNHRRQKYFKLLK